MLPIHSLMRLGELEEIRIMLYIILVLFFGIIVWAFQLKRYAVAYKILEEAEKNIKQDTLNISIDYIFVQNKYDIEKET